MITSKIHKQNTWILVSHNHFPMHCLTKITPFMRKEIYTKYKEKMKVTKWKKKEESYKELWIFYRVHLNTIRKIVWRWDVWDFTIHKSTVKAHLWHNFWNYTKLERKLLRKTQPRIWNYTLWERNGRRTRSYRCTQAEEYQMRESEKEEILGWSDRWCYSNNLCWSTIR